MADRSRDQSNNRPQPEATKNEDFKESQFSRRALLLGAGLALGSFAFLQKSKDVEISVPIKDALSGINAFADKAIIISHPVENPKKLVVIMTEARLSGMSKEVLQQLEIDPKIAATLGAKQKELLLGLVQRLKVKDLYCDGMTPAMAKSYNSKVELLRNFKTYRYAIQDPNLPVDAKKKLEAFAERNKFREKRESFEELAKEFADSPALLAAFNLEISLKGLEPKKELEAMQALTKQNPKISVDDKEVKHLILARDKAAIERFAETSKSPVELFFYGDRHFTEETIRSMNDQGIYVVRITEKGTWNYLNKAKAK